MTYEKLEENIVEAHGMIEKLLATASTGKMIGRASRSPS